MQLVQQAKTDVTTADGVSVIGAILNNEYLKKMSKHIMLYSTTSKHYNDSSLSDVFNGSWTIIVVYLLLHLCGSFLLYDEYLYSGSADYADESIHTQIIAIFKIACYFKQFFECISMFNCYFGKNPEEKNLVCYRNRKCQASFQFALYQFRKTLSKGRISIQNGIENKKGKI